MGMFSRSSRSKSSSSPTDAIDNKKRDSSNRVVGKKDKHSSSSSSSSSSPSPSVSQVPSLAPPVFNKHETQDLHMGHKPITTSNKYKNSTPVHNDPDRPSTTLMAKKQQQREKLQQQKKNQQPINSVTSSTALWTATAINNSQHSEAVSTGEYYEEVIVTDIDDDDEEYDDDFFELVEEEVVEVYDGTNRVDHVVDAVIGGDESTQVQEQHQVIEEEELLDRKITIRFDE
jgi:N-acyl-D-aspartate/D-glutamate deacylase